MSSLGKKENFLSERPTIKHENLTCHNTQFHLIKEMLIYFFLDINIQKNMLGEHWLTIWFDTFKVIINPLCHRFALLLSIILMLRHLFSSIYLTTQYTKWVMYDKSQIYSRASKCAGSKFISSL